MLSHFHLYGEQRSSGVMGRRNGPSGLRNDDDDTINKPIIHARDRLIKLHGYGASRYTSADLLIVSIPKL